MCHAETERQRQSYKIATVRSTSTRNSHASQWNAYRATDYIINYQYINIICCYYTTYYSLYIPIRFHMGNYKFHCHKSNTTCLNSETWKIGALVKVNVQFRYESVTNVDWLLDLTTWQLSPANLSNKGNPNKSCNEAHVQSKSSEQCEF